MSTLPGFLRILSVSAMLAGGVSGIALGDDETVQLIDIGGHALHLHCLGTGQPSIILDAGLGGAASDWAEVQRSLAATRQTCVYDRAGYGASAPGPLPRTSRRIATELRTLLARADIAPPYLLGGHSFGGLNMRVFASLFPAAVAGLVLVDPPPDIELAGVLEGILLGTLDPRGLLQGLWQTGSLANLLSNLEPLAGLLGLEVETFRVITNELDAFPDSASEARASTLAPNLPLIVIAHGQPVLPASALGDDLEKQWLAALRELACAQVHGQYWVAEDSGHLVLARQPALVVQAFREVLATDSLSPAKEHHANLCGRTIVRIAPGAARFRDWQRSDRLDRDPRDEPQSAVCDCPGWGANSRILVGVSRR